MRAMTASLEAAARAYERAKQALDRRRAELAAEIVKAAREGTRQVDIVKATGYTRERVRQIIADSEPEDPS